MNTTILRRLLMLIVLLAGYVSVMGACCGEGECCSVSNQVPHVQCSLSGSTIKNGCCINESCVTCPPDS